MIAKLSAFAIALVAAIGLSLAGFAGNSANVPDICGCVDCCCPECNGEFCSCGECACGECLCAR